MRIYPKSECGAVEIDGFKYCSDLHLTRSIEAVKTRRGEDAKYLVGKSYWAMAKLRCGEHEPYWHYICVPQGYKTDLASVPRPGRAFVSRAGPHLEACVVHDWLYEAWIVARETPTKAMKQFADKVLRAAMKEANVRPHTVWLIYNACKRFGGKDFKRDWQGDDLPLAKEIIQPLEQGRAEQTETRTDSA